VDLSEDLQDWLGMNQSTDLLGKAQKMFGIREDESSIESSTSPRRHGTVHPTARLIVYRDRAAIGSVRPDDDERLLIKH
jgi:hypothetical protein